MALTDARLRSAKAGDKLVKLSDGHGLQFWLYPTGAKSWRLVYQWHGNQRSMTLGPYPEMSLRAARIAAEDARRAVRGGTDPGPRKNAPAGRAGSATPTYSEIRARWQAKEGRNARSADTLARYDRLAKIGAELDTRPIAEIKASEIFDILQRLEARGTFETAKRLRAMISRVFRFAIALDHAATDPASHLVGMIASPPARPRSAVTDRKGFAELLRAMAAYEARSCVGNALMLLALTAARSGELRLAEWTGEIDLDDGVWTIPQARTKMRRAHRVPLSKQAVAILKRMQAHSRALRTRFVCPSPRLGQPISENAFNCALRSMGVGADVATAHGFRSSFSTIANESGLWRSETIEMALAHVDSSVRGIYQRGDMFSERARLMQWWADEIDAMISGRDKIGSKFELQPHGSAR
ncbi:tyrosine-type recombinase/integrase [Methylosinus sp. H3A]|uniref:tyrosine-type recombinase/integrase n=1 Tax=Methylosinus sp. H3A TaxID=2785786 RepID=UPI0018C1EBF4|nr:site-specific integrase [Methylosinus sp. H3A]MBG0811220.1 tyrosine-type recombinase/integrase [Methylosinus sp. H3A]